MAFKGEHEEKGSLFWWDKNWTHYVWRTPGTEHPGLYHSCCEACSGNIVPWGCRETSQNLAKSYFRGLCECMWTETMETKTQDSLTVVKGPSQSPDLNIIEYMELERTFQEELPKSSCAKLVLCNFPNSTWSCTSTCCTSSTPLRVWWWEFWCIADWWAKMAILPI